MRLWLDAAAAEVDVDLTGRNASNTSDPGMPHMIGRPSLAPHDGHRALRDPAFHDRGHLSA